MHRIHRLTLTVLFTLCISFNVYPKLIGFDTATHQLLEININTGTSSAISNLPVEFQSIRSIAYDLNNNVMYASDAGPAEQLIKVNYLTGEVKVIGTYGLDFRSVHGLTYDTKRDILYGVDDSNQRTIFIDVQDGHATEIGVHDYSKLLSMAYDSKRDLLLSAMDDSGRRELLVSIDRITGEGSPLLEVGPAYQNIKSLAYHPEHGILYAIDDELDQLLSINLDTQIITPIGLPGALGFDRIRALTFIPEPTTALTLLLSSAFLLTRRQKHANK